ncbi:MAG: 3-hydroxyacyl-ACP dehydratase FabZ family protein [Planctomycetota bacterium]
MPARENIVDPTQLDFDSPVADAAAIRKVNPQRDHMEQLTAILWIDQQSQTCVGYKDITDEEFWVSGHMPGAPLMPGVVMCEAAAQVCSYYAHSVGLLGDGIVGFGGLEGVRFRGIVRPGDRLVIATKVRQTRRHRMAVWAFQGFVGESIACEGEVRGVQLPKDALAPGSNG